MTEFNPDSEIEPEEEELAEEAPEQSQNRVFILVALGLGGLFVIGLICIGLYAFIVAPGQKTAQLTQVAGVNATNTQQFLNAAGTANPATDTPVPIDTPLPTDTVEALVAPSDTPVIAIIGPTATFTITNTSGPSPTPSRTPTRVGGAGGTAVAAVTTSAAGSATPTRIQAGGITATATRTFTPTGPGGGGEGLTRTPTPTALPDTGFADNFGGPGLFIIAIALIAVVFFARQLRLRNS